MQVFEIRIKVYLLKDISVEDEQQIITRFIDKAMAKDNRLLELHKRNCYKNYCFNMLYPVEADKCYKKDHIYSITIRTVDKLLANFFSDHLVHEHDDYLKALTSESRIIPQKVIEKIYSVTPIILKDSRGYWRNQISMEEMERRLKENLYKKYNKLTNSKVDESKPLYSSIEFINKKPIAVKFKNIVLLGDKISLQMEYNSVAQTLSYLSLGTGLLENNGRGAGFVNYRWL